MSAPESMPILSHQKASPGSSQEEGIKLCVEATRPVSLREDLQEV